jgi:hypothetical protein
VSRYAGRKSISGGFYAIIPERLLASPEFSSLKTIRDIGLYFLLLGRADVYGCLPCYEHIEPTRANVLGAAYTALSSHEFRAGLQELIVSRLVKCYVWRGVRFFLLPHKLPSMSLNYYNAPKLAPAAVVTACIRDCSTYSAYLKELYDGFRWEKLTSADEDSLEFAEESLPEWLLPAKQGRKPKADRPPTTKDKIEQLQTEILTEEEIEDIKNEEPTVTHEYLDIRVAQAQAYITDNGYEVRISDTDMLALIHARGLKYVLKMIDQYGGWAETSTRAQKHKSHYRGIQAVWVHDNVQKTCLPNPDDKLIEIRWNVMVTASERKKLLEIIKKKLRVSDENDAVEWLATLAEKVSGWKAKSGMIATDRDADFILDKIERQAKFREVTNG